jgi:hypothetical protein
MEITYGELFLGIVALIFLVLYVREKHEHGLFRFKSVMILKALAEGEAEIIKTAEGAEIKRKEKA